MNNSQENNNEQVKVSSQMIKNETIINKDILSQKHQYNKVGSNGFLEIEPKEVKFCGYESNKINVQKVKIINTSPYSQRMHIIGPKGQDKNFQIKYESRGQLAPGMSEDILVFFKASNKEYYFDKILIHCQNEKLQIPIHAYPAMTSSFQTNIFPKLIDFGNVNVGDTTNLYFPITNKTNYAFEFEFRLLHDINQLPGQIEITPMSGIVPVKDSIEISIHFKPITNSTVIYEFQLDLSQFEFQLQTIKVYGTGKNINDHSFKKTHPTKLKGLNFNKSVEVIQENDEESQTDPINNSLLSKNNKSQQAQSKKLFSQQQPQNEEQTKNYKTLLNQECKKKTQSNKNDSKQREVKQEKDDEKRLQQEKVFLDKFNKVQYLDKEKEIKFFKCIGDYKITENEEERILEERRYLEKKQNQEIENKGVHRYQIEIGTDFPRIEQKMPDQDCKWDVIKNDKMKKRELLGEIFRRNVTKVIISKLMESRLKAIKILLGVKQLSDFKLITRMEVKRLVIEDWLNAERQGITKEDRNKSEFIFEESSIKQLLFPIQYDQSNQFSSYKFEIDARNGFDDMTQLDNLKYSDAEAMDYQLMETPAVIIHNSIESNRKMRTGAEEEYYLMGETGYLDKLKQDDLLFDKLGETFNQPFNTVPYKLLVPDPFLREHEMYEPITEISPEYNLQKQLIFQSDTDVLEIVSNNPKSKYNFLITCPGLSSNLPLKKMKIEQSYYYQKREVLPYEQGFIKDIAEYCPQLLDGCQEDDQYSEGDSENEENLEITYENHLDFLKKLQNNPNDPNNNQQDQEMQYYNKSKHIESNISQNISIDKKERISLMPSKTYDFNKFIINPENRIFIL